MGGREPEGKQILRSMLKKKGGGESINCAGGGPDAGKSEESREQERHKYLQTLKAHTLA